MSVDPQRRRKKVDFLWFQKLLKVKKFCTSNYLFLSAAGLMLCEHHFTTLSTCWSGFEEWWKRSGKLLMWALEAGRVYEMIIPIIGGQAAAAPCLWMETRIFLFLTFWWNLPGKFLGLVKLCWADAQTGRMLLGQDQKFYGCDKGHLQMRKIALSCPDSTPSESTPCMV